MTFVVPNDEYMVRQIEAILKAKIDRRTIDDVNYGKTPVIDPGSKKYRSSDRASQYKGRGKGRYIDASKSKRRGFKGKAKIKSHRSTKNSNGIFK